MKRESEFIPNNEDWDVLKSFFPEGWEEKARESGAVVRFRKIENAEELLRYLLIHLADGCSLRETAVRIKQGFSKSISDVALLKRLNKSGEWFRWMSVELMKKWMRSDSWISLKNQQIRLIDGSTVQEPGATGTTWRIHYSIRLPDLMCDEMLVTDPKTGETFRNFSVSKGDVLIGDRGYANRAGVAHIVKNGGNVIVRMNMQMIPLEDRDGNPLDIMKFLLTLKKHQIGDWDVWISWKGDQISGRLCAIKKSKEVAEKSKAKVLSVAKRKGRKVQASTLKSAEYIFVFSTLCREKMKSATILELYRGRWQIEIVFKRLKSILGLGHLRKQDLEGSKAWIHGKLFVAILLEVLIEAGRSFFPWGYPLEKHKEGSERLA